MSLKSEPVTIQFQFMAINLESRKLSILHQQNHAERNQIESFTFTVQTMQLKLKRKKRSGILNQNSMISFDIIIAISFYLIAYMNTNEWFHPSCLPEYRWRWWWCSPRLYHNSYYWWCSTSAQFDYNEHRNVPSQREKKESNSLFLFGNWEKLNYFIYSCFFGGGSLSAALFLCIKKSIGEYSIWTEEELLFYSSGSRMRAFWSHTHSVCVGFPLRNT